MDLGFAEGGEVNCVDGVVGPEDEDEEDAAPAIVDRMGEAS